MAVNPPALGQSEEREWDTSLRPTSWEEYIGQNRIKEQLRIMLDSAKQRNQILEHLLFHGSSGLGKTTLASVVAKELGGSLRTCTGPALERAGDVASVLTNLEEGDILFVDECHRVHKAALEMLYSAMEDYQLHLVMGKGPMARTMDLQLPRFTLIGATTRAALLPSPLRNRFGAIFQFELYDQEDMVRIVERSARMLGLEIEQEALTLIASRSRFTPRIANRILKRIRDFALIKGHPVLSSSLAKEALNFFEIDEHGLEAGDRKLLQTIISKFSGGPVGIQALASSSGEEIDTILDLYEPYLLRAGFLERTPKGRVATKLAYQHLGFAAPTIL